MQEVNDETVLGDFDNAVFTHRGVETRFFKKDGKFYANTEGPDGQPADFAIAYVFGITPLQQYLVAFPGGRLQCLTIAWDTARGKWFSLYPDEDIPADDPLHWTGRMFTWNHMCAECHSTNVKKNYDFAANTYETSWSEIDVGCQACHGPGSTHVDWARAGAQGEAPHGLTVAFKGQSSVYQVEQCARCHARRHPVSPDDANGRAFLQDFAPELLREPLYHADGQILDEVYVYGSFVQSKMYQHGVRCTDCHDPHTLKLAVPGNDLCARCHQDVPMPQFPTLKPKRYDTPGHHHHTEGSAGAQCVECHMPSTTYMVVDPRRDHSFSIPRPDLTVKLGTPNACTRCHADQTAAWAAEAVAGWYGARETEDPEYAEAIAGGRAGAPAALDSLQNIALDRERAAIRRASAIELLPQYGPETFDTIQAALASREPLVLVAAVAALEPWPAKQRAPLLTPLLSHTVRAVRTEAARVLADVAATLSKEDRALFDVALEEYTATQLAHSDQPESHLNLALLHEKRGDTDAAMAAYKNALRQDPCFLPAHVNIGNLYNRAGRNDLAEQAFLRALDCAPDEGELHYSLGLLLAELGRLDDAVPRLRRATELMPDRPRVLYNYGLILQHQKRDAEALPYLRDASRLAPDDDGILYALALALTKANRIDEARAAAETLLMRRPQDPNLQQFYQQLLHTQ